MNIIIVQLIVNLTVFQKLVLNLRVYSNNISILQLRRSMIRDENLTAFNANLYCKAFRSNKYPDIIVTKAAATTYSLLWLRKLPLYFTRVLKGIFPLFHVLFAFYKQIFLFPISFCYLSGINSICYRTFSFTDIGIEWTERWLKINKDVKAFAKIRCIHFLFKFFSKYKMHELRLEEIEISTI